MKIVTEGRADILDILLKTGLYPTLYIGLYQDTSEPGLSSTLSTITEVSGGGYSRKVLTTGDWSIVGNLASNLQKEFTASTDWGNTYGYFYCTVSSGTAGKLWVVEHFSDGPYYVVSGATVRVLPRLQIT
jgi:hypothetical protein